MGRRGPPPVPRAILEARGSWRANANPDEPRPDIGEPDWPHWLDEDAYWIWEEMAPVLDRMGVLTMADGNALGRYCRVLARYIEADKFLQEHGDVWAVTDSNGNIKNYRQYPQVRLVRQLADQLLVLEREFGLTPSARTRLVVERRGARNAEDERKRSYVDFKGETG